MTACPQFRYSLVASDLTAKLRQEADWITCGFLTDQRLIMGTHSGLVHVLNLLSGVGFTLENHYEITDVHCSNQYLCYCGQFKFGLYDFDNETEILDYDLDEGRWVRILDINDGSTTVAVGTSEELFLVQKWLFRTTKAVFAKVTSEIHSLSLSSTLLGIANGLNATFLQLPQGRVVWQWKDLGKSTIVFLSPELCAIVTSTDFHLVRISTADDGYQISPLRTCSLPGDHLSVGAYQHETLLVLTRDQIIRFIDSQGKVTFQGKSVHSGILISQYSKENDAFYIVSKDEILKITTYSQAEKLNWYLENEEYEEAFVFAETTQFSKRDVQCRILHDLISKRKTSTATDYLRDLIEQQAISWDKIVEKYKNDSFLTSICLDIPNDAITSEAAENIIRKLISDREENVILRCLARWPERIVFTSSLTDQEMLRSNMTQAKIVYALRKGLVTVAMELLLSIGSTQLFDVIDRHPDSAKEFLKPLPVDKLQEIVQIDSERALSIFIENDWLDTDKIRASLSENQVFDYLLELWRRKKRRNPGSDSVLLRLMLERKSPFVLDLVTHSTGLNRAQAVEICREYGHMEGEIVLLQMLNRTDELIAVLKGNFEQGLEYLQRRDSEELWEAVVNQGCSHEQQAKLMIPYLASYAKQAQVIDRLPDGCYLSETLHLLRKSKQRVDTIKSALHNLSVQVAKSQIDQLVIRKRGMYIAQPYLCCICGKKMTGKSAFHRCSHHTHKGCSESLCRVCSRIRRLPS